MPTHSLSTTQLGDALTELADYAARSTRINKSAQIRATLSKITGLQERGLTVKKIAEHLSARGFMVTEKHLSVLLYRARAKERLASGAPEKHKSAPQEGVMKCPAVASVMPAAEPMSEPKKVSETPPGGLTLPQSPEKSAYGGLSRGSKAKDLF